jgi:hypothetical protein
MSSHTLVWCVACSGFPAYIQWLTLQKSDTSRALQYGKYTIGFQSHTLWFRCFLWLRGARVGQFPLGHPSIASIVPGAVSPSEVERNADCINLPIPQSLWDELKAEKLLAADALVPITGAT